jgi:uncharacterized protein
MKIYHHNDMDGRSAAYIAYKFIEEYQHLYPDKEQTEFIELDYKKEIEIDKINDNETVVIVDYSFTENTLPTLMAMIHKSNTLIWIDHHKSSVELINAHDELGYMFRGIISDEMSGAALTYKYFYDLAGNDIKFEDMPYWIRLVSDYDTWKYIYKEQTIYFKLGMDSLPYHPLDNVWNRLDDKDNDEASTSYLQVLINRGESLKKYIDKENASNLKRFGFESEFEGQKCYAINKASNSWIFGDKIKEYPFVMTFTFNGSDYTYSIYSEDKETDCSKLAEKYGGGGHKRSSGIQ